VKSAAAGKNAMPPKGGAADLTDDELKRAVAFLANKAGAGFKAPD
jgi:cytochrome c5